MMKTFEKAAHEVKPEVDWAELCHSLYEALARSEEVCRREGLRFRAAALKRDLERELDGLSRRVEGETPPEASATFGPSY